jgi:hypothetical protein
MITAESIALSLDKGRRVKADSYTACCPAHDDRSPSLSITQTSDRVLLYCHSGCRQDDVIDALKSRGLWNEKGEDSTPQPRYTKDELEFAHIFCLIYKADVRARLKTTSENDADFREYSTLCYEQGVSCV